MCVCVRCGNAIAMPHIYIQLPVRSFLLLVKTKSSIRFRYTTVQKHSPQLHYPPTLM